MNATIAFSTHTYVKKLKDAGVDERQAEIQADALIALAEDRLATKQDIYTLKRDLADVESNLRKDLAVIEANLKRDIKEMDVKAETRFKEMDAKTETRFREMDTKTETRFREMDAKTETRFREIDGKIETVKADLKQEIEVTKLELQKAIESTKVDTIKWTAGMFAAQTALIIGAMFAVMKMNQPNPQPTGYHTPPVQEMRLPAPSTLAHPPAPQSR